MLKYHEYEYKRQNYIKKMCEKLEYHLNKRIKKLETRDMIRRQIKNDDNEDRLFDFIKCREIKKWNEQEKSKDDPNREEPVKEEVPEAKVTNLDAQHLETL